MHLYWLSENVHFLMLLCTDMIKNTIILLKDLVGKFMSTEEIGGTFEKVAGQQFVV